MAGSLKGRKCICKLDSSPPSVIRSVNLSLTSGHDFRSLPLSLFRTYLFLFGIGRFRLSENKLVDVKDDKQSLKVINRD